MLGMIAEAYRHQANDLKRFEENFKTFGDEVKDIAKDGGFSH